MKPVPLTEQEETYQNDKKFIAGEHGKGFELTIPLKTFYGAYADIRGDILPEDVEGVFKCVYTMNNGGIEIRSYGMPIGGIYSEEEEKRFNAKLLNELMTDDKYSETAEKINHWKAVLKRMEDFESKHLEGTDWKPTNGWRLFPSLRNMAESADGFNNVTTAENINYHLKRKHHIWVDNIKPYSEKYYLYTPNKHKIVESLQTKKKQVKVKKK